MSEPDSAISIHQNISRLEWLIVVVVLATMVSYFFKVSVNPPGFYIDESSIAYNAYTISQSGRDEFNNSWPLYFRAFGDYKNPIYIYLLAALFKLTGPGILVARLLSVIAGVLAALGMGLLSWQMTRRRIVALLMMETALLTPWLFEMSRVVLEVALYPLITTAFLLLLYRASLKAKWTIADALALAIGLSLLTYSYSIGRALAPLLALGLVFFINRSNWPRVTLSWLAYVVTLIPVFIFDRLHPGALTGRFRLITYLSTENSPAEIASQFAKHYLANLNPWRLFLAGDPNPDQIVHLYGSPLLLAATGILAVLGTLLAIRQLRKAWWRYIFFGLIASVVPASLTNEVFHMLRLAPALVFLLVLAIPGLIYLYQAVEKRKAAQVGLIALVGLTLLQGAVFQWKYHRSAESPRRRHLFDADYQGKILAPALQSELRPINLNDHPAIPGYIQAYWHATLMGQNLSQFYITPPIAFPPRGALVIGTDENPPALQTMASVKPYILYIADEAPEKTPLSDNAFRAEISVTNTPTVLEIGAKEVVWVKVKNLSDVTWKGRTRTREPYQISLGNHWLTHDGQPSIHDDGRSLLLTDLGPREEVAMSLTINAPRRKGNYLLELDMLQEGVSWFALKGSRTVRIPVTVTD